MSYEIANDWREGARHRRELGKTEMKLLKINESESKEEKGIVSDETWDNYEMRCLEDVFCNFSPISTNLDRYLKIR